MPVVCVAQDNPSPADQAIAPAAGPNAEAEEHRAKAESGDALAQAMLADALYYLTRSEAIRGIELPKGIEVFAAGFSASDLNVPSGCRSRLSDHGQQD